MATRLALRGGNERSVVQDKLIRHLDRHTVPVFGPGLSAHGNFDDASQGTIDSCLGVVAPNLAFGSDGLLVRLSIIRILLNSLEHMEGNMWIEFAGADVLGQVTDQFFYLDYRLLHFLWLLILLQIFLDVLN